MVTKEKGKRFEHYEQEKTIVSTPENPDNVTKDVITSKEWDSQSNYKFDETMSATFNNGSVSFGYYDAKDYGANSTTYVSTMTASGSGNSDYTLEPTGNSTLNHSGDSDIKIEEKKTFITNQGDQVIQSKYKHKIDADFTYTSEVTTFEDDASLTTNKLTYNENHEGKYKKQTTYPNANPGEVSTDTIESTFEYKDTLDTTTDHLIDPAGNVTNYEYEYSRNGEATYSHITAYSGNIEEDYTDGELKNFNATLDYNATDTAGILVGSGSATLQLESETRSNRGDFIVNIDQSNPYSTYYSDEYSFDQQIDFSILYAPDANGISSQTPWISDDPVLNAISSYWGTISETNEQGILVVDSYANIIVDTNMTVETIVFVLDGQYIGTQKTTTDGNSSTFVYNQHPLADYDDYLNGYDATYNAFLDGTNSPFTHIDDYLMADAVLTDIGLHGLDDGFWMTIFPEDPIPASEHNPVQDGEIDDAFTGLIHDYSLANTDTMTNYLTYDVSGAIFGTNKSQNAGDTNNAHDDYAGGNLSSVSSVMSASGIAFSGPIQPMFEDGDGGGAGDFDDIFIGTPNHPHSHGFTIRDINPTKSSTNCAATAVATDELLGGHGFRTARDMGHTNFDQLERIYGSKFENNLNLSEIEKKLEQAGPGSRAIIYGHLD